MGEEKPKIRWQTYAVAACWAVFLIAMARVVPPFRALYAEMDRALPVETRVVVGMPVVGWIALGVLAAAALVWKSKLVSKRAAELIDLVAVVAWFLAGMGVVIALFLPFVSGPLVIVEP